MCFARPPQLTQVTSLLCILAILFHNEPIMNGDEAAMSVWSSHIRKISDCVLHNLLVLRIPIQPLAALIRLGGHDAHDPGDHSQFGFAFLPMRLKS